MKNRSPRTQLEETALATIKQYRMLEPGDLVVVGFSGGGDSVALLDFLWRWREPLEITLKAVHLNHLYRGEEAHKDQEFCRVFCLEREIPFVGRQVDVDKQAKAEGRSFQLVARDARYQLFEEESRGGKTATAHTLSDSVETVLLNLTRGTGLAGLGGIPPVRGGIVRPLIGVTRDQVEDYCKQYQLGFVTDRTNLEEAYGRNKIRLKVVPVLRRINPALEQKVGQMTQLVGEDAQLLDQLATVTRERLTVQEGILRGEFLRLPRPISHRILGQLLKEAGLEQSLRRIVWMYEDVEAKEYRHPYSYWTRLVYEKESFRMEPVPDYEERFEVEVPLGEIPKRQETQGISGKFLVIERLECKETENIGEIAEEELYSLVDYDKIGTSVVVRQSQPEDRLGPVGKAGRVSLTKLYKHRGLGVEERRRLFVLADHQGVLWVEGWGVDRRAAVSPSSSTVVRLTIREETKGSLPLE